MKKDERWYEIRVWGIITDTIIDDIKGLTTRRYVLFNPTALHTS